MPERLNKPPPCCPTLDGMYRSRGLREKVVRGLARVGLVWALAVLAALFMAMSAAGLHDDDHSLALPDSARSLPVPTQAPRTAGLALALVVLAGGLTVLAIGASRGDRAPQHVRGPRPLPAHWSPEVPQSLLAVVPGEAPPVGQLALLA